MLFCKAVALAASVCVSVTYGARIKAASKRIIDEQPLADQQTGAASAASISHQDDGLSLDELLALDDRVMPATAPHGTRWLPDRRRWLPEIPLQMATRSKKRKAPEVPATELQEATLPSAPSKKRKGPEPAQHSFDGALQDEVRQNRWRTEAVEEAGEQMEDRMRGNSSAYDLELELDEVDDSGTEGGFDISELLSYMADALEDEADDPLVGLPNEAQASGGLFEDLWGSTPDDVDFEETMQKYEEEKCTAFLRSGSQQKRKKLTECCKTARIWSNCDHGKRFLANMIRRFNQLCKDFPSLPRHRIAKVASLQDLGLLPKVAVGEGTGSGIGKWLRGNWLRNSNSKGGNSKSERDPCIKSLARMPVAKLKKCCADRGLDASGSGPVMVARLKEHARLG